MNGQTKALMVSLLLAAAPALALAQTTGGAAPPAATAATPGTGSTHHATRHRTTTAPSGTQNSTGQNSTAQTANLTANEFSTEAAAKAHCPSDTVVWANTGGSKVYHLSGDRYYGKTKHGAYMCQKDAAQTGFHQSGKRAAKAKASG
jgi:hypothetical protein